MDEGRRAIEVLTRAFESDPPCRWAWPDAERYLEAFPRFACAFGGAAFDAGTAHGFGGFAGVALWLQPGSTPDETALIRVIGETMTGDRRNAMFAVFEQMGAFHPEGPHWHLPLIGVDPASQGRGVGSALMRPVLKHCDRSGLPAYLEATSPRNVALYRRLGFQELGVVQEADCPPIVPMVRQPR